MREAHAGSVQARRGRGEGRGRTPRSRSGRTANTPLQWNELSLWHTTDPATVPQVGGPGGLGYYHWDVTLPTNRSGHHIIFVHWVRSDSPEDFFSCADVNLGDGPIEPVDCPDTPAGVPGTPSVSNVTQTSANVSWGGSSGCVTGYDVVNTANDQVLASTTGATSATLSGLTAETSYSIAVQARNGNISQVSALSPATSFTTSSGPGEPDGDCAISYNLMSDWGAQFQASVDITNTGPTTITSWQVTWTFPSGQGIAQLWNGNPPSQSGPNITVSNAGWNGIIAPGDTVNFGFLGSPGGGSQPTEFFLNGNLCS